MTSASPQRIVRSQLTDRRLQAAREARVVTNTYRHLATVLDDGTRRVARQRARPPAPLARAQQPARIGGMREVAEFLPETEWGLL